MSTGVSFNYPGSWSRLCFGDEVLAHNFDQLPCFAVVIQHRGFSVLIRADARVSGAALLAGTTLTHSSSEDFRHADLAPAQGVILVNGQRVAVGEGIAAIDEHELTITAVEDAEFILVDAA